MQNLSVGSFNRESIYCISGLILDSHDGSFPDGSAS